VYVALKEQGFTNSEIAEQLKTSEASVRRGLAKAKYRPHLIPAKFIKDMAVVLDRPITMDVRKDGPGAITADWHIPLTNFNLVNEFLDHAIDIGATNWLGIAGDFWNQDFFSQFDFKQADADFPRELFAGSEVIRRVLEVFDQVVLTYGNHDARMLKVIRYAVDFETTMKWCFRDLEPELLKRIKVSNLDYFCVDTPRGQYRLAHPRAYNAVALTNARKLAAKHHAHIITGHSHHTAIGHDVSGKFTVAEIGGFFDADKTQYLQRSTTFPVWQNGYGFIAGDGYLIVEGQGWSSRIDSRIA
jgi:hypothetical protein